MRLPETSKRHLSFHYVLNVKKSKTDVTDMLSFLDYYTVNVVNVKNHTSFFKKICLLHFLGVFVQFIVFFIKM